MLCETLPALRGIPWRPLTILRFAACLLRYNVLVRRGAGEAPVDVPLSDPPLQLAGLTWLALFAPGIPCGQLTRTTLP